MEQNIKEVRYDIYCSKCEHFKKKETDDPCNDCLGQPWNVDSKKPIYFKEKKNGKGVYRQESGSKRDR